MKNQRRQFGISMFGIVIVLMIVGVLTATLAPMLLSQNTQSTEGSDRRALEAAKTAIVGYTASTGRLPSPVTAAGVPVVGGAGLMPPSTGAGAIPSLGVNNYGMFGRENPFRMDVNDALAAVVSANPKDLCAAAQAQLSTPGPVYPRICQQDDTCTILTSTPVAFVLYSTGHDRAPNLNNALTTRTYQNDNHGIDNSTDAVKHYDDQLVSYPLSSLVTDCAKLGGVPVCAVGPATQTITRGSSATLTASCSNKPVVSAPTCTAPYTWTSSDPVNAPAPTGTGGIVTPTLAGTYTYTLTGCNEFGSSALATAQVVVTPAAAVAPPVCTMTPTTWSGQAGTSVSLTAMCTNNPTYMWSVLCNPEIMINVGGNGGRTCIFNATAGINTVTVTATNADGTGTASAQVTGTACATGSKNITFSNTGNAYYILGAGACTAVPASVTLACTVSNTAFSIYRNNSCNQMIMFNLLGNYDANADGTVACTISGSGAGTSVSCN